jgi:hypothetical protein
MAGTIVADTIKSSLSAPPVFQNTSGTQVGTLCRAWVCFDSQSTTVYASFNVSSVTFTSQADHTVNFINAFADANFATVIGGANPSGDPYGRLYWLNGQTTSTVRLTGTNASYTGVAAVACFR